MFLFLFRVGAALLTKDGQIFQGCNIENASFDWPIVQKGQPFCYGIRRYEILNILQSTEIPKILSHHVVLVAK